MMDEHHPLRT
jgi:DNA mismatch repair ATPase MutS